jgi:hypothetical protein
VEILIRNQTHYGVGVSSVTNSFVWILDSVSFVGRRRNWMEIEVIAAETGLKVTDEENNIIMDKTINLTMSCSGKKKYSSYPTKLIQVNKIKISA